MAKTVFTRELLGRSVSVATRNVPGGSRVWMVTPDAPCLVHLAASALTSPKYAATMALFRAGRTYRVHGLAGAGVVTVVYLTGNAPQLTIVDVTDQQEDPTP